MTEKQPAAETPEDKNKPIPISPVTAAQHYAIAAEFWEYQAKILRSERDEALLLIEAQKRRIEALEATQKAS